jgi:type IV pilus assembly protein PilA
LGCDAPTCTRSGYSFTIIPLGAVPISNYSVTAIPLTAGQTGVRGFCTSQLSEIKIDPAGGSNCTISLQ